MSTSAFMRSLLTLLFFVIYSTDATRTVPFSTSKSAECINECINLGNVFCGEKLFGFCCRPDKCGE